MAHGLEANTDDISTILRVVEENEHRSAFEALVARNPDFLLDLMVSLEKQNRFSEAVIIGNRLLAAHADHRDALRAMARISETNGDLGPALSHLIRLRNLTADQSVLLDDIRRLAGSGIAAVNDRMAGGRIGEVFVLLELLMELCPGIESFAEYALNIARAVNRDELVLKYQLELDKRRAPTVQALENLAQQLFNRRDFEGELQTRVAIFRHAEDAKRSSVMRVQNIDFALSRIFIGDISQEKIELARELIAGVTTIPAIQHDGSAYDRIANFDRFWRLSISCLSIDRIFGPRLEPRMRPSLTFATSDGKPLSLTDLSTTAKEMGIEAVFFSAASAPYFSRYAKAFSNSILKSADCRFLIVVCVSGEGRRLHERASELGIKDPRVILCADDLNENSGPYAVYTPTEDRIMNVSGAYYASIGHLCLHFLLKALNAPMIMSGIDTLLQREVRDMLDRFAGADVVFNLNQTSFMMESRLTNSLVMVNPTDNGQVFGEFLNRYLGDVVLGHHQPAFFDQLSLLMGTHYLKTHATAPKIEYFDEFDTNNIMFTQKNYEAHRDLMARYRFVNIFSGGELGERAVRPEDIAEET